MQKLLQGHTGLRTIGESRRAVCAATVVGDVVVVVSCWWGGGDLFHAVLVWRCKLLLWSFLVAPGADVAARSVLFGCCSVAFDVDQAVVVASRCVLLVLALSAVLRSVGVLVQLLD
jgi:hypothetical protein